MAAKLTGKMVSRLKTPTAFAHRKSPGSIVEEMDGDQWILTLLTEH